MPRPLALLDAVILASLLRASFVGVSCLLVAVPRFHDRQIRRLAACGFDVARADGAGGSRMVLWQRPQAR